MPLKAFREIPKNLLEWGRYLNSLVIQPDPDSVDEDTIQDGAVTFQKIQNVTPDRLLGRDSSPAGVVQELTVSGGLEFTGSGIVRSAFAGGDVTAPQGSNVLTLRPLLDADIPSGIARDSEVSAAITAALTNITSGTYTPTLTNTTNLDATVAYQSQWLRVGNTVFVSGKVDIDPTAAGVTVDMGMSLPVASNFGSAEDCAGTGFCTAVQQGAAILADATNDRARWVFLVNDTANRSFYFSFGYRVI
jgi:hypothetical protein